MLPQMIDFIKRHPACFDRNTIGHVTGSAWIVSDDLYKALLTHHKKLNLWFQLGGHADCNSNIEAVALQEAYEESGIEHLKIMIPGIYDIDIHAIPNACTYHYDIRYLIKAPADAQYTVTEESHDLAWVPIEDIHKYTTDRSVLRMAEKMDHLSD